MKFLTLFIAFIALAPQQPKVVKVKDLLNSAYLDIVYRSQKEKLDYLRFNPFKVPLLRRVEFRTETHEFELSQQEYAIRISPNSFGERKYNKKYYETSVRINEIRNKEALNEALSERYKYVINLIKTSKIFRLKQQLELLLEDRMNVLNQSRNTVDFDYEDLLNAEDDYHDLQLDLIDLERQVQRLKTKINQFMGLQESFELDTTGFVDVNFIEIYANTLSLGIDPSNLEVAKSMENVVLAEYDFKEEKAHRNNPIGFFQTSYENDFNDPFRSDLRLSFGIRLPIANSSQPRLNRLYLRQLDRENDLEITKDDVSRKIAQSMEDLGILILKYKTTRSWIEEDNTETSLRRYLSIEGISPLILLKIQESIILKEIILGDLEKKIFDEYLKLLKHIGKLVEQPLRNYFSKGFELISE